jgi:hypothetical protein
MDDLDQLAADALANFRQVARLAGSKGKVEEVFVEIQRKPHTPGSLPYGKMAVYSFFLNGRALKIGKAGPNSGPRYKYQHYSGSAISTLSGSIILNQNKVGARGLDTATAGGWIKAHTDRINLLMPAAFGTPTLSLLEAFLHVLWNPMFEGRGAGD